MGQIHAAEEATIPASAPTVYAILADYRSGHPHILPKRYFPKMTVEEGGIGAGTMIRVRTRVMGNEREYRMRVSEPEPGRVLAESDTESDVVTTFTVDPAGPDSCRVRIETVYESRSGLLGRLEKLMTEPVLRRIYRAELDQLNEYVSRSPG